MIEEFKKLIYDALSECQRKNVNIYTFALYHDHESGFVSVCVDTEESSKRSCISINEYKRKQFLRAIEGNEIKKAQSWLASTGRSLSLGDFAFVNLTEIIISEKTVHDSFYLNMVNAIEEMSELIVRQSEHGKNLIFCCSTGNDEVGLIWSNKNS